MPTSLRTNLSAISQSPKQSPSCLAHSLLHKKGFDPVDQMNRYCNWQYHGYLSSAGECFDIGATVASALNRYIQTKDSFAGSDNPADTTAAIVGQLAGAYYGVSAIPHTWLSQLSMRAEIEELALGLFTHRYHPV